jgi:hypothetical protein
MSTHKHTHRYVCIPGADADVGQVGAVERQLGGADVRYIRQVREVGSAVWVKIHGAKEHNSIIRVRVHILR